MTGNNVWWLQSVVFEQPTSTSNTALVIHVPTPLGRLACLKRGQKTRLGTFLSVLPAPCFALGMKSCGSDEKNGHREPIDGWFWLGSQRGAEMMRTCGWVSTGVETPERLSEGVIGNGESDAE